MTMRKYFIFALMALAMIAGAALAFEYEPTHYTVQGAMEQADSATRAHVATNATNSDSVGHSKPAFPVAKIPDSLAAKSQLHAKADSSARLVQDVFTIDTTAKWAGEKFNFGTDLTSRHGWNYVQPNKSFGVLLDYNTGLDQASSFAITTKGSHAAFCIATGFNEEGGAAMMAYPFAVFRPYITMVDPMTSEHLWAFSVFDYTGAYARFAIDDTNSVAPVVIFDNTGVEKARFGSRCSTQVLKADSLLGDGVTANTFGMAKDTSLEVGAFTRTCVCDTLVYMTGADTLIGAYSPHGLWTRGTPSGHEIQIGPPAGGKLTVRRLAADTALGDRWSVTRVLQR
jgi:hypothetical protein